ncbi:LOW QUALITY PROTEIN: semaphorin-6C [Apus apus]|uniref:LOW QUALITY PROTEIN: semaphorin-6C n=1 Tax=Apus apus TaxID=8895 RepID=UPI0021F89A4A|nr:LOW QUALITY PROTEIN: semaphorin-6C [Apus apus]
MPGVPLPLVLLLLIPGGSVATFPRDLLPRSTVGLAATAAYPRFGGLRGDNLTAQLGLGFQRMLRLNRTLLLAARDHIYAFDLGQDAGTLTPQRHLTWETRDREHCAMRGRLQDECHNYIRVLVPRDAGTLLVCGTNGFSPLCRTYQVSSLAQEGEELSGQARCPFDAKQSVVALFVDGSLYSATVADFQASDAVIYRSLSPGRPPLRSLKYSSRWLQEPHFVQALPYGPYVYFFFREVAVELSSLGKVVVARVARVCRNDAGGSPRALERRWTSFLKVRLLCALPGDTDFYFDVLEAVTPPRALHGRPAVLALFGTQPNSIPGSAVCAFYLGDVERAFEGPFAEPRGAAGTWGPVPEDRVPQPRPGCCAGMGPASGFVTSGDFPDETLAFAKEHPLLHGAVAPAGGRPLVTRTGSRLTQLAADTGAGPRGDQTVLFLGTEDGRVLKVLVATRPPGATRHPGGTPAPSDSRGPGDAGDTGSETLLLEEISLYDPGRCRGPRGASRVLGLELNPPGRELLVAFAGCLVRLPLSRCARHGACRRSCLAARDPYCVWLPPGGCVPFSEDLPTGFEQDMEGSTGITGTCQDAPAAGDGDRDEDLAHGVRQAGPGAAAMVPVPVLVGCVLGAFTLGALATGLLVAICRRPPGPKGPPEPPATPRPPAQPPVPRLYPLLPPQGGPGALRDPPELPTPEPTPQPPTKTPRERGTEPRRPQITHLGTPGCPEPPRPGTPTQDDSGAAAAAARAGGLRVARDPPGHRLLHQPGAAGSPVLRPPPGPPGWGSPAAGRAPRQPPPAPPAPGSETLPGGGTGQAPRAGEGAHPHALPGDPRGAALGTPARRPGALPLREAPRAAQAPAAASGPRAALSPPLGTPPTHGTPLLGWWGHLSHPPPWVAGSSLQ